MPKRLGRAHITVNKNGIPNDPQKPFVTSGIRIGSPAMTTRGFTEIEAEQIAHLIADVLTRRTTKVAATVRQGGRAVQASSRFTARNRQDPEMPVLHSMSGAG